MSELHDFLRDALVGEEVEVAKVDGGFPVRHCLHCTITRSSTIKGVPAVLRLIPLLTVLRRSGSCELPIGPDVDK